MIKDIINNYETAPTETKVKVFYNYVYIKSFTIHLDKLIDFCKDCKKLMHNGDTVEIQSTSGETITIEKADE